MAITFEKVVEESTILNPMNSFAPDTGTNEHRIDPLTKETSFIATAAIEKGIKFPTGLDEKWLNEVIEQTKPTCFFCPENIEKATPKFPPEILPEGRLQRGEACLFPNMLAMAKLTAVVTLSKRHFFRLDEYSPEMLSDAFILALEFAKRVHEADPSNKYVAIGGNCLFPSGSSIVHPHIHIFINSLPLNNYGEFQLNCSRQYFAENSTNYWSDLVETEKKEGQRYIINIGTTDWLTSFAPLGSHEIRAIVKDKSNFMEFTDDNMIDLAKGLSKVLGYYHSEGVTSFNLVIYSGPMGKKLDYFSSNLKIVSRFTLPPLNVGDITWRQRLMNRYEALMASPEPMASDLRKAFQ